MSREINSEGPPQAIGHMGVRLTGLPRRYRTQRSQELSTFRTSVVHPSQYALRRTACSVRLRPKCDTPIPSCNARTNFSRKLNGMIVCMYSELFRVHSYRRHSLSSTTTSLSHCAHRALLLADQPATASQSGFCVLSVYARNTTPMSSSRS